MRVRLSLPDAVQSRYSHENQQTAVAPESPRETTSSSNVLISVIIPTYDDPFRLPLVLEGLCRQTYRHFEVIVVNDGGSDVTEKICNEYSHRLDLSYTYLNPPKTAEDPGRVSAARNQGTRISRGELLLFQDGDCIADANMLEVHAAKFAPHRVTFGFRRHLSEELARQITLPLNQNFLEENSTPDRRLTFGMVSPWGTPNDGWIYCHGFNMAIPAHAVESLGGFDECMIGWASEDIEIAFRLRFGGMHFLPLLGAMVTHIDHPHREGHPANPFVSVVDTGKIHPLRAMTRNGGPLVRSRKSASI